jgi:hypothetical protein
MNSVLVYLYPSNFGRESGPSIFGAAKNIFLAKLKLRVRYHGYDIVCRGTECKHGAESDHGAYFIKTQRKKRARPAKDKQNFNL